MPALRRGPGVAEMSNDFERIKHSIEQAADIMRAAVEKDDTRQWDYFIVAVPETQSGEKTTTIAMLSSVAPEELPYFVKFLDVVLTKSIKTGRFIDDRSKPEGKPS
jgi:hypothetical protein